MAVEHNEVSERERLLDEVLGSYFEALAAGRAPDRQELLARHPDLALELADFFADEEAVDRWTASLRSVAQAALTEAVAAVVTPPPGGRLSPAVDTSLPFGGGYDLLEEIGRGGMGVVYKAHQKVPSRLVALKVIRAGWLASRAEVQRFRAEAEAAASLDHPNIVPVYEVGEHDGQPFFSTKLVEGGSLAGQPYRYREDPKGAARLVATVARAVHHAHQRGILHRDLKPSNVLLDGEGRPHVTDFGLAKRLEGDGSLTESGALVGTPSYMAPEQAAGLKGAVTTATDVYGLGAVLYALLTGRPPFRADTAVHTLLLVRERDPEPPRRLNAGVDTDLETICLKSLHKDPPRRYGSAEALAEDLERWLAGEPIQARRTGSWERLGKWVRRRPALAGLVVVSVLAVMALLGGLVWHNAQLQEAARREHLAAEGERQQAEQARIQRDQAREEREWAHQAVDNMYTEVAEKWLEQKPRLQPLQRQFLEKALRYYQRFAQEPGTSPQERLATAEAYRRVADIRGKLGDHHQAIEAYRQGKSVLEELDAAFPNSPEHQARLALVNTHLGIALAATGAYPEAKVEEDRAVRLLDQLVLKDPASAATRRALVKALGNLGNVHADGLNQPREAEEAYSEALRHLQQLTTESPDNLTYQRDRLATYHNLGKLYHNTRRPVEAVKAFQKAREIGEGLVAHQPRDPEFRVVLADSCSALGLVQLNNGVQSAEVEKPLRRSEGLLKTLVDEFPDMPEYREILALTQNNLGNCLSRAGRDREAEEAYRDALNVKEGMMKAFPQVPVYREDVVQACNNLTLFLREAHRLPEAREINRRAQEVAEQLVKDFPADRAFRGDLARCHQRLAEVCQTAEDFPQAAEECRLALKACPDNGGIQCGVAWVLATLPVPDFGDPARAVELARKATQAAPQDSYAWRTLGLSQYSAGDARAAIEALSHALRLEKSAPVHTLLFLSMAHARLGHQEEARRCYEEAVGYMSKTSSQSEEARRLRAEAAQLLGIKEQPTKQKEEVAPKE
jgi:tetratricopeptide (TPR) repeat protein